MNHIADWDAANEKKHPVIGVQINNEFIGMRTTFPNSLAISYLNGVAGAVKQSDYVVWTRANCVFWNVAGRIQENEAHRLSGKRLIFDFVELTLTGIILLRMPHSLPVCVTMSHTLARISG